MHIPLPAIILFIAITLIFIASTARYKIKSIDLEEVIKLKEIEKFKGYDSIKELEHEIDSLNKENNDLSIQLENRFR